MRRRKKRKKRNWNRKKKRKEAKRNNAETAEKGCIKTRRGKKGRAEGHGSSEEAR